MTDAVSGGFIRQTCVELVETSRSYRYPVRTSGQATCRWESGDVKFKRKNLGVDIWKIKKMKIVSLTPDQNNLIQQAARILVDAFRTHSPHSWPTLESGLDEVHEMLSDDRIMRVALDTEGNAMGWIGGIPQYDGHVWELHPLVVKPELQGKGIGRALVFDFEEQVRSHGALTIMLGADDEDNRTSLSNVDLYADIWRKIKEISNFNRHPYEFYQKMGYTITGVMPDANGIGKPDIFMSKRILP
jgi:aminoglycoside 6'-N-acetyltransferase I